MSWFLRFVSWAMGRVARSTVVCKCGIQGRKKRARHGLTGLGLIFGFGCHVLEGEEAF